MLYEDKQYKISRDRLLRLLSAEYEIAKQDQLRINSLLRMDNEPEVPIESFNKEKALSEFEELPSNDKKVINIKIYKEKIYNQ